MTDETKPPKKPHKKYKARGKAIRWSKKVEEFILDKIVEGYDVTNICEKWPDDVPTRKTVYNRSIKDLEFGEKLNNAYSVLFMIRMDELHKISGMTASEAYPEVDWREAEATLKRRMDEMKFVLGKLAPVLSHKFDKAKKLEVKSNTPLGPQIAIINYYKDPKTSITEVPESLLDGLEDAKEDNTVDKGSFSKYIEEEKDDNE